MNPGIDPRHAALFEGTPYRPVRRLGIGGMGEVFLVEQTELGRRFAAKLLHARCAKDVQLRDRLRIEAQSLAKLNELHHPNIAQVVDFRTTGDGRPFYVMEYLEGRSLAEELSAHGGVPIARALRYAIQLLSALDAAHQIGVVHRDIKPPNLFLRSVAGAEPALVVLDFGIARVMPHAQAAPLPLSIPTESGVLVGTPQWTSPEGAMGLRVDHRADIYSAGLVLYRMIAGQGPFDKHPEPLQAQGSERPEPPSRYAPYPVPIELDRVILKALEKSPADRYRRAVEFADALAAIERQLRDPSGAVGMDRPARESAPPIRVARQSRAPVAAAAPDRAGSAGREPVAEPQTSGGQRIGPRAFILITLFGAVVGGLVVFLIGRLVGGP